MFNIADTDDSARAVFLPSGPVWSTYTLTLSSVIELSAPVGLCRRFHFDLFEKEIKFVD